MRRTAVYGACAHAVGIAIVTNHFCSRVAAAAVELGAVPIAPHNVRQFAFMRPRQVSPKAPANDNAQPAKRIRPGSKEFVALQREWDRKLAAEGFDDIEKRGGALKRLPVYDAQRAAINSARIDKAQDVYWRLERDRKIMELYAIEGLAIRPICERLNLARWTVAETISRLMGTGHLLLDEETSDDDGPGDAAEVDR